MRRMLSLTVTIITALSGQLNAELNDHLSIPLSQCGINSLYFCLRYFGYNTTFQELYSDIIPNSNNEVNLRQLCDYARQKGLFVDGLQEPSLSDIMKNLEKGRCVILQWTKKINGTQLSHIMPIVKVRNKGILVFDFPINKMYLSIKDFSEYVFSSKAALIIYPEERYHFLRYNITKLIIWVCAFFLPIILLLSYKIINRVKLMKKERP